MMMMMMMIVVVVVVKTSQNKLHDLKLVLFYAYFSALGLFDCILKTSIPKLMSNDLNLIILLITIINILCTLFYMFLYLLHYTCIFSCKI